MKTPIFTGSGVAIVTPMYPDGTINFNVLSELIEDQIANKTDAIIACGTTGEASTLDDAEHLSVIEHCVKVTNKRIPVIAGTGSNNTSHAIELSKEAAHLGADAILQVTPYYNKTNQAGLIKHFTSVVDAANIPTILYNVPSRTGMSIAPETCAELSKHPLIVATKEACGDISKIAYTASLCGDDFGIYSGNDDQVLPILALGGLGVISVVANVAPKLMHDMCEYYLNGDSITSTKMQLKYLDLCNVIFNDVNPIPIKSALRLMGWNVGPCRLPLVDLSPEKTNEIKAVLVKHGLLNA